MRDQDASKKDTQTPDELDARFSWTMRVPSAEGYPTTGHADPDKIARLTETAANPDDNPDDQDVPALPQRTASG